MKKIMYFILIIFVLSYCGPKQEKVERYMEDGVEVIVNHLEPYKIKGEPNNLILKEEFVVDTERDDIAEVGLADILDFEIDSEGNIYIFQLWKTNDNFIYKFDAKGNFIISFARRGQGPEELQWISRLSINKKDEITVSDHMSRKLLIFSKDGEFIRKVRGDSKFFNVIPLDNGKYLVHWQLQTREYFQSRLLLCSSEFEELKVLDEYKTPNPFGSNKEMKATPHIYLWEVSKENIYIGNEERDYEICVYDLEGKVTRKIKKEYKPVKIPEEFKKERRKVMEKRWGSSQKVYFPKYWPPFNTFIPDDKGRLFVRTYEEGEKPGEYILDIFNPDGIFIGRTSLKTTGFPEFLPEKIKNNYLYRLREKESGYKELVVYKMRWE